MAEVFAAVEGKQIDPYHDQILDQPLLQEIPAPGRIVERKEIEELGVSEWRLDNGARVILDNGAWGLVRASSNTPNLVVVCESPESEAEMRAIFADIDAVIRTEPSVGDYDQTI